MEQDALILGESLELLIDNRGKNPPYESGGIPAVSGKTMAGGRLDLSTARTVSAETWQQWMPNPTRRHDLILTSEAPLGRVALIPNDDPLLLAQRVFGLRGRLGVLDTRFLYYAFQTDFVKAELEGRATGTTVLGIRQPALLQVRIPAPSYLEQRAIAEVLGALDDKIAANTKLAETAITLAHLLYENAVASNPYEMKELGSFATVVLGGTPSKGNADYWMDGTVPWLNSGKANEDFILEPSTYITQDALARSAAKLMPSGSTVLAITGATLGQVARLEIDASGNQSLVGIWTADETLNAWLYLAIQSHIPELMKKATGAAQQHVNKRDVETLAVPVPADPVLASVGSGMLSLLESAAEALRENQNLAATRDALLPQLMSGKLQVKDIENTMGEMV